MLISENSYENQAQTANNDPRLAARGIGDAASQMQWQATKTGWVYDIHDTIHGGTARRFKAFDSTANPKYRWLPTKPANVTYYHAPDLKPAVVADGLLYIAAGEIDVLTYMAAGFSNVVAWFGEGNVPATLAADLLNLGVSQAIYAPDKDDAGFKSAIKVRDALSGSGIHLEIKQLPDALGKKGDTNDLWKLVKFDNTAFRAALETAPELLLPPPAPKVEINFDNNQFDNTPDGLIQAIVAAALARGFKGHGKWLNGLSPFRDEKRPSFGIHIESGAGNDFNGDTYSSWQVAAAFGIDPKAYYPKPDTPYTPAKSQPLIPATSGTAALQPDTAIYAQATLFPNGLPNSWRSNLLDYAPSGSAALFEIVNESVQRGLLNPDDFTRADLQQAALNTSQSEFTPDVFSVIICKN